MHPASHLRSDRYDLYGRRFGMAEETRRIWLPVYAFIVWFFASPRVAEAFITAYVDPARGSFWPPRAPLPGVNSTAGHLLLTFALAYAAFAAAAVVARYTYVRRREDVELLAWAVAARDALVVAYVVMGALLVYPLVWLRPM